MLSVGLLSCSNSGSQTDLNTPEATFNTIVQAIQDKDINTYKNCFTDEAIERGEPQLKDYERDPDRFWQELQGLFKGPQSIEITMRSDTEAGGSVTAPEADGGGIGGMTFQKINSQWKIQGW